MLKTVEINLGDTLLDKLLSAGINAYMSYGVLVVIIDSNIASYDIDIKFNVPGYTFDIPITFQYNTSSTSYSYSKVTFYGDPVSKTSLKINTPPPNIITVYNSTVYDQSIFVSFYNIVFDMSAMSEERTILRVVEGITLHGRETMFFNCCFIDQRCPPLNNGEFVSNIAEYCTFRITPGAEMLQDPSLNLIGDSSVLDAQARWTPYSAAEHLAPLGAFTRQPDKLDILSDDTYLGQTFRGWVLLTDTFGGEVALSAGGLAALNGRGAKIQSPVFTASRELHLQNFHLKQIGEERPREIRLKRSATPEGMASANEEYIFSDIQTLYDNGNVLTTPVIIPLGWSYQFIIQLW